MTTIMKPSDKYACDNKLHSEKSWIWLIFSFYYFVPLYYKSFSLEGYVLLTSAYALFVAIYLWGTRVRPQDAWRPISMIVILALLITPYTPGSSTFFTYLGFLLGYFYSTRRYLLFLGMLLGVIAALQYYYPYPIPAFVLPAVTGIVTISIFGYIERMRLESRISWIQSRQEIEQLAVIAERERIARDLHDILGHSLSSIALKAELAEKLLKQAKHEQAQQHLSELHQIARNSLSLVRQTVSGYKHRGLSGEVMQLCDQLRQKGFVVELKGEIPQLSARAETAIILALTELTTNVLRHSKGNHCRIMFRKLCGKLEVSMHDNGEVKSLVPGNGLSGIQERLHALAGDIQSSINKGCEFTISLPLKEQHQA